MTSALKTSSFWGILLALLSLISCRVLKSPEVLYQQAIANSMMPDSSKMYDNLISINKQNKNLVWKSINGEDYLLVVSWTQDVSYYQKYLDSAYYNTGNHLIWITTVPELLQKMETINYKDADKRLRELLGVPPYSAYKYFVEFWVKPADLFRPCPDREISDSSCSLCFPNNTDSSYVSWFNNNRLNSYYPMNCELNSKYPWTQLGYTYDWNYKNKSHIGLSEFVIYNNKNIKVKAIYTTKEYLNGQSKKP